MSETRKMYRAHVHFDHKGAHVFCTVGNVSECGKWVQIGGETRYRLTAEWFASEARAKVSKADEVSAMGVAILRQADELRAAYPPAEGAA